LLAVAAQQINKVLAELVVIAHLPELRAAAVAQKAH
jgi:hypothetical protein